MSQPFVGQILAVGFNFAPAGWALCNGQILAISDYVTLYTLIGTTYGGDGQTTFALPNLQGRAVINQGQGPGLSTYLMGQLGGSEQITLTSSQVGSHAHGLMASSQTGSTVSPGTTVALAHNAQPLVNAYSAAAPNTTLAPASISPSGGGQPHENRQPYLVINYIISLFGVFPSQG